MFTKRVPQLSSLPPAFNLERDATRGLSEQLSIPRLPIYGKLSAVELVLETASTLGEEKEDI